MPSPKCLPQRVLCLASTSSIQTGKGHADLKEHIKAFHTRSDGTCGAPRIWKDLMDVGIRVGKRRIARLMRELGICGISRRKSMQTTRKAKG